MRKLFSLFLLCLPLALSAQQPATVPYKLFFEKAYLHTDREAYAAGEDIWFSAYLVNAQTNQLFNSSNNLYVELISPGAKIAERKLIRLEKGLGKGDFHLGDSIAPGAYRLRAYTNWMRNFGDAFVFEKPISIFSDIQPKESPALVTAKKSKSPAVPKPATAAQTPATQNASATNSAPTIRFFPEGGSIITGAACVVAFKAEASNGKGTAASGKVLSPSNELITEFTCDASGMGSFYLPAQTAPCKATGTFSTGQPFDLALPAPLAQGFSLTIRSTDSLFRATISTNAATLAAMQGKELRLMGRSKGIVFFSQAFPLAGAVQAVSIPKASLPAGITALTLYDAGGKPACERLVYNERPPATVSIQPDKPSYSPKGKASITMRTANADGKPIKASLSLSVADAGLAPVGESNIAAYLNLSSEVKGEIEHAAQYFDPANPRRRQQLDLLLLTQGWRDFLWKAIADSAIRVSYAAEQGISISGKVRAVYANKPLPDMNITLFAPRFANQKLFSARTDPSGRFYLDGTEFYGYQYFNVTSRDDKGKGGGWIRIDSLAEGLPYSRPVAAQPAESGIAGAPLLSRAKSARRISLSDTIALKEVVISNKRLAAPPEVYAITSKDYDYSCLLHYLLNKIPGAQMDRGFLATGSRGTTAVSIRGSYTDGSKVGRMMMGRWVQPVKDFLGLSMEDILKISISQQIELGMLFYSVSVLMRPGALEVKKFGNAMADMVGYYEARTFFAPKYAGPSSKQDLRTTIHWEPNISTNEKGEAIVSWYNADPKTKVRIVAEGVTANGTPVSSSIMYEVK